MDDPAQAEPPPTIFPAGLVASPSFDDFESMAAAARGWDHHYLKLSPGRFRGRIEMAHTGRMQLALADWSCGILASGSVPAGAVTFGMVAGSTMPARHAGVAMRGDQLGWVADRDELHLLHPQGCQLIVLSLMREWLDEMAATVLGEPWAVAVGTAPVLDLRDGQALEAELRRLHAVAIRSEPAALCRPGHAVGLERAAAEAVLSRLRLPPRRVGACERRRLARRTEDYLRANDSRCVTIAELCAAVGASERTLHAACREYFGLPPIAFLRTVRLHGARRQLRERRPEASVTTIAMDWGFYHFGEFAASYRRLFGEPPSRTLRAATGGAGGRRAG
ncbi:MAG: helix-turn-helix domain-containing protein [Geminicoccaceae bacterium]